MNIAILIPTLSIGGAERVAAEISKYFFSKNHRVYIFTEYQKRQRYDFAGRIVGLKRYGSSYSSFDHWPGTLYGIWERAAEVKRLKKKYKIDVSISFMELYNLINVLSRTKDRVVVRVCTVLSPRSQHEKIYHPGLIRHMYNHADIVVAISNYGKRDLKKEYGIRKDKIRVIPNAVETYQEPDSCREWIYGENVIICLARISEVKQQGLLVDIFSEVKQMLPDAVLLLAGSDVDDYAVRLKKRVRGMPCAEAIHFTGHIENVKYFLSHSRLCVLLSKVEGFGNATIEAMSVGVPVMCMESPGASREILAPHTRVRNLNQIEYAQYGILVPFIDEDVSSEEGRRRKKLISAAIVHVLQDEKARMNYAKRGKARAARFNVDCIGGMWEKLLGE